jgi:hypothetical protein
MKIVKRNLKMIVDKIYNLKELIKCWFELLMRQFGEFIEEHGLNCIEKMDKKDLLKLKTTTLAVDV